MTQQVVAIILAVGGLLPLLTSVIQQPHWSDRTRTIVGIAVSVVAGLVTYVTQYGLDVSSPSAIVTVVVGVVIAAAAAYRGIWRTSGLTRKLEIVTSTSGAKAKAAAIDAPATPYPDVTLLPSDVPPGDATEPQD